MSSSVLEITDLEVAYTGESRFAALRGVNLEVASGTAVALVGESGSGKTSLILSIMGLIKPPTGEVGAGAIRLEGENLLEASRRRLRRILHEDIGYIPQDPTAALDPLYTIGRQIDETLSADVARPRRRPAIVELLESLGVAQADARFGSYPHEFSGGMNQRVAIATALARNPKLIIADEPTTALDVTTQLAILRLIDELRRERDLALLFVTHDLSVARVLCQQVVVLYAGKVVEAGPMEEVMNEPRHPYTRALIDAIPSMTTTPRARLRAIPGQPPTRADAAALTGCSFVPRCPLADARCVREEPQPRLIGGAAVACWNAGPEAG